MAGRATSRRLGLHALLLSFGIIFVAELGGRPVTDTSGARGNADLTQGHASRER